MVASGSIRARVRARARISARIRARVRARLSRGGARILKGRGGGGG